MSFPHHPGVGPLPPLQSQGCELSAQRHNHNGSSAPAYTQHPRLPQLALPSLLPKILHPWFISSVDSHAPWGPHVPSLGTPMAGYCLQPCLQVWVSLLAPGFEYPLDPSDTLSPAARSYQPSGLTSGFPPLCPPIYPAYTQRRRVAISLPQAWKNVADLGAWE